VRTPGSIGNPILKTLSLAARRNVQPQRLSYTRKLGYLTSNPHTVAVRSQRRRIDPPSGLWLVRRIRSVILFGCLASLALLTFASPAPPDHLRVGLIAALFLFCAWAVYRPVLRYVGAERQQRATLAEDARLEGATLATRTMRHHLANKLAAAVGYSELLVDDPRLPHELEEQAQKIMASAQAAVETLDRLQERIVRVELDASLAGPPLLDLDASIAGPAPTGTT